MYKNIWKSSLFHFCGRVYIYFKLKCNLLLISPFSILIITPICLLFHEIWSRRKFSFADFKLVWTQNNNEVSTFFSVFFFSLSICFHAMERFDLISTFTFITEFHTLQINSTTREWAHSGVHESWQICEKYDARCIHRWTTIPTTITATITIFYVFYGRFIHCRR